MCRLLIRRIDNHQIATATAEEKRGLWQRGDVVEVFEDGVSFGTKVEPGHSNFTIFECPGVPAARMEGLAEPHPTEDLARRVRQIDLTALRGRLTGRERADMDTGKLARLVDGETKINDSSRVRRL